jgi:hypothetical protein
MAAAASFKGRAIAGSFVSRVLAGKAAAASPRYMLPRARDTAGFAIITVVHIVFTYSL